MTPTPATIAATANRVRPLIRADRRGPVLDADSPRAVLLRWLWSNDPNGDYADDSSDYEPLSLADCWALIGEALADDLNNE
jgi:hypothetical protein